ncbi:hypothetical protein PTET_a0284 [Pseudoalteromonas tetraodonis]|nr:hypothetical protein PSM_A0273 [Pseudoalteromonas sp. SM9913]ATD01868.1 hypothetical protein PTET_a0284 [Pseudoalteromonas tetraodonis]
MALRLVGGRDVFSTAFLFVLLQYPPFKKSTLTVLWRAKRPN